MSTVFKPSVWLPRRLTSAVTAFSLGLTGVVLSTIVASPASAAISPIAARTSTDVTADVLPTAQIDGVVWDQAIVGNTVWAGGEFTKARPAGAAAGVSTTTRNNLLAYNLSTGALLTTAVIPTLNAQAKVVAASPDGSRIYVGGTFGTANGVSRSRIAAYNASTGALITTFAPTPNFTVNAIVATATTVYIGGGFTTSNGLTRSRLAAYSASNGAITTWAPSVDQTVNAMTLTGDGSKIIVGGKFQNAKGSGVAAYSPAYGMAAFSASTGAMLPWAATTKVRDAGDSAAILSLTSSGNSVYGTGYVYGPGGNLEGTFKADQTTGNVQWIEDCHGDTYDATVSNGTVYTVSHAHYCGNIGGFPQTNPWTVNQRHALAFTDATTGTIGHDPYGYYDWFGTPSPSLKAWFPQWTVGDYTGATQAAWSTTSNSQYVIMGGEFKRVNNIAQQGLVRFAIKPPAPAKVAPTNTGANFVPTLNSPSAGTVNGSFKANSDKDSLALTYQVVRDGNTANPIYSTTVNSTYWNQPTISFSDAGVSGGSHTYRLYAVDSDGNTSVGNPVSVTVAGGPQAPTAAFTTSTSALKLNVDGSASSDPDGTITAYLWNFGDGTTATERMSSRTYTAPGTYQVSLRVTDNSGLTNTVTKSVTVTAAGTPGVLANDEFNRTLSGAWGSADQGGNWTVTGGASNFSVASGTGKMTMNTAGTTLNAQLAAFAQSQVDITAAVSLNAAPTGGGVFITTLARSAGNNNYRLKLVLASTGKVTANLTRMVGGAETTLATAAVAGVTYAPNAVLNLRFRVVGSGTTTLSTKVWPSGAAEPANWLASTTDSTAALQGNGAVGFSSYLSGSATTVPVSVVVDKMTVTSP